jgi:hypothetical protein
VSIGFLVGEFFARAGRGLGAFFGGCVVVGMFVVRLFEGFAVVSM